MITSSPTVVATCALLYLSALQGCKSEDAPAPKPSPSSSKPAPPSKDKANQLGQVVKPGLAVKTAPALKTAPSAAAVASLKLLETVYDEGVFGADLPGDVRPAKRVAVTASSVLCEPRTGFCHHPRRIVDGESKTAWCEGAPGNGVGATFTLDFGAPRSVHALRFEALYGKSKRTVLDNARVRKLAFTVDDGRRFGVAIADQDPNTLFSGAQLDYSVPGLELRQPLRTRRLIFEVLEVYPGRKFEDLCVSEITAWIKR